MRFNSSSVSTRLKVLTILLDRSSLAIQTCTSWEDGNLGGTCEPFIHPHISAAENRLAEGVVHIPDSARLGLEIAPQEVTQHSVRRNETLPIALESETCTPVRARQKIRCAFWRRAPPGCGPQARWLCCSLLTYRSGYARRSRLASGPGGQQQNVHLIS